MIKEARYKIIQNDILSWKNHVRTYRYDDSKYSKMIVIDQLVTPTPQMILLWWWTKGYPMKTYEI